MVTEERFYVGSRRSLMAEVWPATLFTSKYSPLLFSKGRFFKRAREEEGGRGREKNRQRTKRKKTRGGSECLAVCRIWVSDLGPWRLVAWSAGNLFSRPSPPSISLSLSLPPPLCPTNHLLRPPFSAPSAAKAHTANAWKPCKRAEELFAPLSSRIRGVSVERGGEKRKTERPLEGHDHLGRGWSGWKWCANGNGFFLR